MNKLFLVGLLLAAPLQAQEIENEWSVISNFCSIGPPAVCQIEADSILSSYVVRELEITVLDISNNGTTAEMQAVDSLIGEIIWRVEFIAEVNEKYGGDNAKFSRLVLRLKRAQAWVRD